MRHRAASQTQRTRRFLSQEAMKRSHRRGDLIRLAPDDEPTASSPHSANEVEPTDEPVVTRPCGDPEPRA
jgi:hypothetical protein